MTEARRVVVVPYDPRWPVIYEEARREIMEAVGSEILGIEHVGSTSIPGLAAKPTIDMQVDVRDFDEATVTIQPLEDIGWEYKGEYGFPRRHYFRKSAPDGHRTHHLHMLEIKHPRWDEMLLFRDFLREHPTTAGEYAGLKRELAEKFQDERGDYIDAKAPFIQAVLKRARSG